MIIFYDIPYRRIKYTYLNLSDGTTLFLIFSKSIENSWNYDFCRCPSDEVKELINDKHKIVLLEYLRDKKFYNINDNSKHSFKIFKYLKEAGYEFIKRHPNNTLYCKILKGDKKEKIFDRFIKFKYPENYKTGKKEINNYVIFEIKNTSGNKTNGT